MLEPTPRLETCYRPGFSESAQTSVSRFAINANLNFRGMVVLANTFFPSWQATLDGRREKIYEAYCFLQGVVADGGHHPIVVWYRADSLDAGLVLALGAIAGLFVLRRAAL